MERKEGYLYVLLLLFLSMGLVACRSEQPTTLTDDPLRDLVNIDELREVFNAADGKPRLLLILAPT